MINRSRAGCGKFLHAIRARADPAMVALPPASRGAMNGNLMESRWIFPGDRTARIASSLGRECSVSPFVAGILARNGMDDAAAVEGFLRPRLRTLSDPNLLPDMPAAVARMDLALKRRERIVLYGDYDVDGVSSLAILARLLMAYGGVVECFLPSRMEEGYGLSRSGIERCFEVHRPELLIAVDCGTNSVAEVAEIRRQGVEVIIVDHHEFAGTRPDCVALVNPKRCDDFHYLCSAGLAFKLAHALLKHAPMPDFDLKEMLDIVAMATLADLVPLVGENRILVSSGLRQLAMTRWPGLTALMEVAGVNPPVSGADVGFRLGPRINAAGRLGTAREALELLLSNDSTEAAAIAASLDRQNRERQGVERAVAAEVISWVEEHHDPARHAAIVAGDGDWHDGVLGIVASKVMRRYHRPTLVVGFQPDGAGKGSGRSIEGVSLVEALGRCSDYLDKFGGHEMAAGLTLRREHFEAFREAFLEAAQSMVNEEMLVPRLVLDAEVSLGDIGMDMLEEQESLEPFGMGNPQPLLVMRGVAPASEPRVLKEKHLRIEFNEGRRRVPSIFFDGVSYPLPRPPWDVAFRLERNCYNGRVYPQIQITAIRGSR